MMQGKWIWIVSVFVLIGGLIISASVSEHNAEAKAKSFCAKIKTGDDFNATRELINSTAATDKLVNSDKRLSIMFSSYDPQSVYACEIIGTDGKITALQYRHLEQE